MNRKLSTKTQIITPNLSPRAQSFSNVLTINPDSEDLLERKGVIYCAYSLSSPIELDVGLTTKIIQDLLHDSYYQSENISPIQSLEKALVEIRDKVFKLTNDSNTEFDIITAALWGNILYFVRYGEGTESLLRDGEMKRFTVNSEGKFSTTSGIIKGNDVAIITTNAFAKIYAPDKLLNTSISVQDLPANAACLIMKFQIETGFSHDEMLDISPNKQKTPRQGGTAVGKNRMWLSMFSRLRESATNAAAKLSGNKNKNLIYLIIPGILFISLVSVAIVAGLRASSKKADIESKTEVPQSTEEVKGASTEAPVSKITTEDLDKTIRTNTTLLYDVKIVDSTANPSGITLIGNKIFVADSTAGSLYVSTLADPKFTKLNSTYPGIRNLAGLDGKLTFTDATGYKVMDVDSFKITEADEGANLGASANYLDFVYAVSGDAVQKFTKDNGVLKGSVWASGTDFKDATSIAIAINIYITTSDGRIVMYTKGEKDQFEITNLSQALGTLAQVVANNDYDNLYFLDAGQKRILVTSKKGTFLKQYRNSGDADWIDMKWFSVDDKEKLMVILDGSIVYRVDL